MNTGKFLRTTGVPLLVTAAVMALGGALGVLAYVLHVPVIIAFPAIYATFFVVGYFSN